MFKGPNSFVISMTQNCIQNETPLSISEITTIYSGYEEHCHWCNFSSFIYNLFRIPLIRIYVPKQKIKLTNKQMILHHIKIELCSIYPSIVTSSILLLI